jgi:hypothetical protein
MKKINLFTNWFESPVRPKEFDYCLKKNLMVFDRVINLKGRPTFQEFFANAGRFAEDVNVVANLDIYFDQSIELARWITEDQVYCLTRYEDDGAGNIQTFAQKHYGHPGEWSQDAWIFTGVNVQKIEANFHLGDRGCDNHLAYLFNEAGLIVQNPSEDIRAIHTHTIDVMASSKRGKKVGKGHYLKVDIGKLKMV